MSRAEKQFISNYYQRLDHFLRAQISVAVESGDRSRIETEYQSLLDFLGEESWCSEFQRVVDRHVRELSSAAINILGFEQFSNLSAKADVEEYLIREREQLADLGFLESLNLPFDQWIDPTTRKITEDRMTWISRHDVKLESSPDLQSLIARLYMLDGLAIDEVSIQLFELQDQRYFMAALHCERRFLVGHGPVETLFGLSTFCHEIGHTSTPRIYDLLEKFHQVDEDEESIHDEKDSYRYEKILIDRLEDILDGNADLLRDYKRRLHTRKALQFNYHLLDCFLSFHFFSGSSMSSMKQKFREFLGSSFSLQTVQVDDWWKFSSLDRPLSKLGYVKAYQENFRSL